MITARRVVHRTRRAFQLLGEGSVDLAGMRHALGRIHNSLQAAFLVRWSPVTGKMLHAIKNRAVPGAPAEIAVEQIFDLLLPDLLVLIGGEEGGHVHHEPRSAEAALRTVLLGNAVLHGTQLAPAASGA